MQKLKKSACAGQKNEKQNTVKELNNFGGEKKGKLEQKEIK